MLVKDPGFTQTTGAPQASQVPTATLVSGAVGRPCAITPAEASKQLLRAHVCQCEACGRALDVPSIAEFCVKKLCDDGRTLLGAARRLRHGSDAMVTA